MMMRGGISYLCCPECRSGIFITLEKRMMWGHLLLPEACCVHLVVAKILTFQDKS